MPRIRVLIVDDAVVIRRMLTDVLSADEALEVAGAAANGRIALAKIPQVNPDVVLLDVEMPDMNGLETLTALRKLYPKLPVIMFSTLTERGAATTLEALSLGATDYATKPANVGSVVQAQARVRDELIPKIKTLAGFPAVKPAPAPAVRSSPRPVGAPRMPQVGVPAVVAIGVSTGGPNALAEVLPALPATFPVPILVVQHMPPLFTRFLADRLASKCTLRVKEAEAGMAVEPGQVYIAPGDWHMTVERTTTGVVIRTNQEAPENSCRPAVDPLFRSCAAVYGAGVLGVVLTGMGQDGLRGAEAIHEAGGGVLAQDEATSVVWGMPGYVAHAGLADRVLPLFAIAPEIERRVSVQGADRPLLASGS